MIDPAVILNAVVNVSPVAAVIVMILGTLVVIGQAVIVITPSKSDDEKLAAFIATPIGKFLIALSKFGVIQKK